MIIFFGRFAWWWPVLSYYVRGVFGGFRRHLRPFKDHLRPFNPLGDLMTLGEIIVA